MKIAPSLLSADFSCVAEEIRAVQAGGADWLHLDVMDGRFVPNITWGPKIIGDLRKCSDLPFDCHLMIVEPERYVEAFRNAGADIITVHLEASSHAHRLLQQIRSLGAKAGISINPQTPVSFLEHLIEETDVLLVMSVNPGFGGQRFIAESLVKLREARELIDRRNPDCILEIDGGVGDENIVEIARAGADVAVMGNSIFNTPDPKATVERYRSLLAGAAAR